MSVIAKLTKWFSHRQKFCIRTPQIAFGFISGQCIALHCIALYYIVYFVLLDKAIHYGHKLEAYLYVYVAQGLTFIAIRCCKIQLACPLIHSEILIGIEPFSHGCSLKMPNNQNSPSDSGKSPQQMTANNICIRNDATSAAELYSQLLTCYGIDGAETLRNRRDFTMESQLALIGG